MNEEVKKIPLVEESVGTVLMRALLDEVMTLRTPWAITPQQTQTEVIERLRTQVEAAVNTAVRRISSADFAFMNVRVESLTIKDEAKAQLTLARGTEEMHQIADRVGSRAMLVFSDSEQFVEGMHVIKAQLDQPQLPLE